MNKFLKLFFASFLTAVMTIGIVIPVSATATSEIVISEENGITVYENVRTKEKSAIITLDPNEQFDSQTITVYWDSETNEKVELDIVKNDVNPTITPMEYNPGSWSEGTIPWGSYTLYPHITNPRYLNGEIGFSIDVSAYPVVCHNAYNPVVRALLISITDVSTSVIRTNATSSFPAKASLNWTASGNIAGIQVGTTVCYLICEINNDGQIRLRWNY